MRHLKVLLAALLLACAPAAARADFGLGARLGYMAPSGTAFTFAGFGNFSQSDLFASAVPLEVELSYGFLGFFRAGVYGSYAWAKEGTQAKNLLCANASSCEKFSDSQLGVGVQAFIIPVGPIQPWVGVKGGYEWSEFRAKSFSNIVGVDGSGNPVIYTADLIGKLRGWTATVEGGVDFKFLPVLQFGPYVAYNFGQYKNQDIVWGTLTVPGNGSIPSSKTHGWTTLGVKTLFVF